MTARTQWNLDQLKSQLARRSEIRSWIIHEENIERRERYFLMDGSALAIDQDRAVQAQNVSVKVCVNLPGKSGRQGETTKKLSFSMPLAPQLDSAIQAALATDVQAWDLPAQPPQNLPQLKTADPRIQEDLERSVSQLTQQIAAAVARPRASAFNSAELFVSMHDLELHLSNGLRHRTSQSRVYAEAAYSFSRKSSDGKVESDEYLSTRWAVNQDDLQLEKMFDEAAERAERSLDVRRPAAGTYAVIVDSEVLAAIFSEFAGQLTSVNSYNGLPFIAPGTELIPGASGDLLSITVDPTLPFGADAAAVSDQGVAQTPLKLVDRNQVASTLTDKQYADYLKTSATTVRGDLVIEGGQLEHAGLTKQAPRVLEILQFSGLFVNGNNGTFASEIRLAKLYDNETGKVEYIKGGSLSGSVRENFRGARFSKSRVRRANFGGHGPHGQGYYGPEYALLSDVSIAGD